jgi:hypothetical protein
MTTGPAAAHTVPYVKCPDCGEGDDPGEVICPSTGCLTRCDRCSGAGFVLPVDTYTNRDHEVPCTGCGFPTFNASAVCSYCTERATC